jgi:hypothetical protein
MFDWTQRGVASTHRYRGFYDAGENSTTHCEQCNRVIRYCYSMHDWTMKSFVIGTCCFENYKGTVHTYELLQAAAKLQIATKSAIVRDTKLYGALSTVKDRRRQWSLARRKALRTISAYRRRNGKWLPKELFDLWACARLTPPQYKRPTATLRWLEKQTAALVQGIENCPSSI